MGRHIKVGKFEANLPGIHTLPVTDAYTNQNTDQNFSLPQPA